MTTIRRKFLNSPLDLALGWQVGSPKELSEPAEGAEGLEIPRVIHTMYGLWDDDEPGLAERFILGGWVRRNPTWRTVLWRKPSLEEFLDREYPHYCPLYESFDRGVQKADFLRYLLVFHYGGAYVDLDLFCLGSLRHLLVESQRINAFFSTETVLTEEEAAANGRQYSIRRGLPEKCHRIANYFFLAKPRHVVLERLLALVEERSTQSPREDYDVLYITGPDAMTEAVLGSDQERIVILPRQRSEQLFSHLCRGGWRRGKDK